MALIALAVVHSKFGYRSRRLGDLPFVPRQNIRETLSLEHTVTVNKFGDQAKQLQLKLIGSLELPVKPAGRYNSVPRVSSFQVQRIGHEGTGLSADTPSLCMATLDKSISQFLQQQTYIKYSADKKQQEKLTKQQQQDMVMAEASTASTTDTIGALVNEALKGKPSHGSAQQGGKKTKKVLKQPSPSSSKLKTEGAVAKAFTLTKAAQRKAKRRNQFSERILTPCLHLE
ncbi:uncharacterized protein V1513DRAFT_432054 [Lipomyces chichibuensis]|uniref:uncharacterized protein n=1 Tax=Lipomyces chichibuensis TaxID=1546026 RepID=UPI0033432F8A